VAWGVLAELEAASLVTLADKGYQESTHAKIPYRGFTRHKEDGKASLFSWKPGSFRRDLREQVRQDTWEVRECTSVLYCDMRPLVLSGHVEEVSDADGVFRAVPEARPCSDMRGLVLLSRMWSSG
jgi:hypothetical protein